ncbi:hypothetical protein [Blastococcus capsensis]|uniref:hypothetical protein n=1 Tax=Blastococcus capsensis TaxID=1564163 RepID=UPI002540D0C6|nr:hypothetical protein [Blastococcus capsensis]MDK3258418.1 hypothetical protein [Blastococcus capsensis]
MCTTRRLRRWSAGGAALLLAAAVTACGSDGSSVETSGDTQAAGTPAAADPAEFCEASVDVEASFAGAPPIDETTPPEEAQAALEEFGAEVEPLLAHAEETAPSELAEDVGTAVGAVREALAGDMSALDSDEYVAADDAIDEYMLAECGYEHIEATGVDYEYEGIPDTVPAGTVAVTFTNEGEELHEIGIARINDDVSMPLEEIAALPPEESESMIQFTGAAFAHPGGSDTVFLKMEPGRYGAACFVPQGTTHDTEGSGPPHMALGMLAEFEVE